MFVRTHARTDERTLWKQKMPRTGSNWKHIFLRLIYRQTFTFRVNAFTDRVWRCGGSVSIVKPVKLSGNIRNMSPVVSFAARVIVHHRTHPLVLLSQVRCRSIEVKVTIVQERAEIQVRLPDLPVIPRLHDQAIIKQTSTSSNWSTRRARVFWMHLLDVCSMIARCLLDRVNGVLNGVSCVGKKPRRRKGGPTVYVHTTRKQLGNPKVRYSESFRVLSHTLLQTLTQYSHFFSTKSRISVKIRVRVRVRVSENACCTIHFWTINPPDYRYTVLPLICQGQRPISGGGKKAISQSDCSPIHAMVTLLYRALQLTLRCDTVMRDSSLKRSTNLDDPKEKKKFKVKISEKVAKQNHAFLVMLN